MGFQQGLSGLNGASKALEAIGNNVSNAGTVGFKSANVQFGDVFAASLSGGGVGQVGIGVGVSRITQAFTQGSISVSNNPLDMAVNGGGFFRMSNSGAISYSRNGQFQLDKNGFIVNSGGLQLTGFSADPITGAIVPGSYVPLQMNTAAIPPQATALSQVQVNLDSRATPPTSMTAGTNVASLAPASGSLTIVAGTGDTFNIAVDGLPPQAITIPPGVYTSVTALATAMQTAINAALVAAGNPTASVTVSVNTSGQLVVTSGSVGSVGSQGLGSSVVTSINGANTGFANFFGTPVSTAGRDNFNTASTTSYTASTAQTVFDSLGNPHTMSMYYAKTARPGYWQMYTALDNVPVITSGSVTGTTPPALTYGAGANGLSVTVDGTPITPITLSASYATPAALASSLQAAINADAALVAANKAVNVNIVGGNLVISSRATGTSSTIAVSGTSTATLLGAAPVTVTGSAAAATLLQFSSTGALTNFTPVPEKFPLANGAKTTLDFNLDLTGSTQYGITFGANQLLQDGFTSGKLSGLSVAADGTVQGRYSNGKSRNMGQIVLASFNNPNGLQSLGGNQWSETSESGQPIPGIPGSGTLGVIQSGSIEESNVDMTAELVQMITQQRAYQANAQTIKTIDQLLQTLVNLR
ncbi:MAG: flagellar hook protein FlgE [Betaproteobacteria bacterium]|nr:flagellar hook protein FlgE [Betaproteobacteria bacterium]